MAFDDVMKKINEIQDQLAERSDQSLDSAQSKLEELKNEIGQKGGEAFKKVEGLKDKLTP